jgi:hypothetical protein
MQPRLLHAGHDEWRAPVGVCPRCRGKDPRELFADDVGKIHTYLAKKNVGMVIWGDHLIEPLRGKVVSDRVSPTGYKHQWPGGLTPEQVREKIPKDILIANWFWKDGSPGQGEVNETRLEAWGFRQFFGNFTPEIGNYGRRSGRPSVIGGAPSSWAATTELNFGKDLVYDFLGCANLLWSTHWFDPKELTATVQARMPQVRRAFSGVAAPSADNGPPVPLKIGATAIPVGQDASSLIFLHAAEGPARNEPSYRFIYNFEDTADLLGHYEVVYEDGFVTTIPIRYGANILERNWRASGKPGTYVYGADPIDTGDDATFFAFEWVNPRFGKVIREVRKHGDRVLLKSVSVVKKRSFPEPVKATESGQRP